MSDISSSSNTAKKLLERYASNIEKLEYLLESEDDQYYILFYNRLIVENKENIEKLKKQFPELII